MEIEVFQDKRDMGGRAAAYGAKKLRDAVGARGEANMIIATGASQFEMLDALVAEGGIDWSRVTGFHLDEYIGLPMTHPASFRGYLKQRLVDRVKMRAFHYVNGEGDPRAECARLGALIAEHPIDVAFVGIGENGHLAFNDPPADFETNSPYIVVTLDEACRRQQSGEGWFESLEAVSTRAISMSIQQIMKSRAIVCTVPDDRKARAVRDTVEGAVTPDVPASMLQKHGEVLMFLDAPAASLLSADVSFSARRNNR